MIQPTLLVASPETALPVLPGRLPTGIDRLDTLLAGGWLEGSSTLLFGPPYCGKEALFAGAIVAAAKAGRPCTILLHSSSASSMSRRLRALDPTFANAEAQGLVAYLDLYTHTLGGDEMHAHSVPFAQGQDLLRLAATWSHPAGPGLLAVESASTLLVDLGAARAFGFLRILVGRATRDGGVAVVSMEAGMNSDMEAQMLKYLCNGMVEFRRKGEAFALRVEGHETAFPRAGWLAYEFTPRQFRLTGSFASQSIA